MYVINKQALFRAVVEAEAQAVTEVIDTASTTVDTLDALAEGSRAFFDAMSDAARAQLLLVDGPAVLGAAEMDRIDAGGGRQSLLVGLKAAHPDHDEETLAAMAVVLSAAFDRAALEVAQSGADPTVFEGVLNRLMGAAFEPK